MNTQHKNEKNTPHTSSDAISNEAYCRQTGQGLVEKQSSERAQGSLGSQVTSTERSHPPGHLT